MSGEWGGARHRIAVDEEAFVADWDAGLTGVELAAKYGVSTSTVTTWSRRFDCSARKSGRQPGTVIVDDSPRALTDGEWVTDARGVQRWEARPQPVKKPVVKRVPGPPRGPRIKIDEDEFRELWDFGLTVAILADRYGCSLNKISELARQLDCPYRTPGRRKSA